MQTEMWPPTRVVIENSQLWTVHAEPRIGLRSPLADCYLRSHQPLSRVALDWRSRSTATTRTACEFAGRREHAVACQRWTFNVAGVLARRDPGRRSHGRDHR